MSIQSAASPGRESAIFAMVLIGSTFLLATSFVAGRVLVLKVDPLPLVGWRFLLAAIATLPLAIWEIRRAGGTGLGALLPRRDQVWVVLLVGLLQTGLVMGLLFFLVVTPIALLMRLFGKRPLHLETEPDAESYWIPRDPPGPEPDTMKQQF